MTKVSIVIPALNEERAIGAVLDQIPIRTLERLGYSVEVLVVDNGSIDRTAELAQACGARVIHEPQRGYGRAYAKGFMHAHGDWIITGDADMTYPFDMIPKLLQYGRQYDVEFITTNRLLQKNKHAMSLSHYVGNQVLSTVARWLFGWPFIDSQSGMWIFRRSVWNALDVRSSGMPFSQEIKAEAYLRGFRCVEIPIPYRVRSGNTKLRAFRDGVVNLLQLGLKYATVRWRGGYTQGKFAS